MTGNKFENVDVHTARWFNNADAPVTLLIDGLNNSLFHPEPDKSSVPGADRGHLRNLPGSTFSQFKNRILQAFPDLKATFFWTVGDYYSKDVPVSLIPSNHQFDPKEKGFIAFLKGISALNQVSVSYNGCNYFTLDTATQLILGEYESLPSAEKTKAKTEEGLKTFETLLGHRPNGGKFPGFHKNRRSVDGIKDLGLSWWCTGFAPLEMLHEEDASAFNLHKIEGSETIHFPATFHGSSNSLENLDFLLERQKVISIIDSYSRFSHQGIQLPNLIDDMENLVLLLTYLRDRNVWFATVDEIVGYWKTFHDAQLERVNDDTFAFRSISGGKFGFSDYLTLIFHGLCDCTDYAIICPDGIRTKLDNRRELFRTVTVPVRSGLYKIIAI